MLITDRRESVTLNSVQNGYSFSHLGKVHKLSSIGEVHAFFRKNTELDSIKFTCDGQKHYAHFFDREVEVYSTKKALRRTLSQEGGGTWIEEKAGKKRYFVEEKGWLSTNFKEVSKEDCVETPSVWQKVLGLGLGMLALAPGVSEVLRHVPVSKEAAMGALALQQQSPLSGLFALSMMPSEVFAQAMGTEFQINSNTTNDQVEPSIVALSNGGFVSVWASSQSGNFGDIYGQIYSANGLLEGSNFLINTYSALDQSTPSVAALSGGGFVVTWASIDQDGDGYGIYGQRYNANGAPVGFEFQVNTNTTLNQEYPSVAALNNGRFVVSWTSLGQDGDSDGIYAQVYDENGAPIGSEFRVNTYTTGAQEFSTIAPLNDGGFVVTWTSAFQDGDQGGVFAQIFDPAYAVRGSEFQVNTYSVSGQQHQKIAVLENGGFVITWSGNAQDGDFSGIFAQKYASNGTDIGNEFQVNTYIISSQDFPAVAALRSGGFVVIWQSLNQDGDHYGIFGQMYDVSGALIGNEFQANSYTTSTQKQPAVAGLSDGGFLVAWASIGQDGDGYGIYGQRYTSNGRPIPLVSTEFRINEVTQGSQTDPSVAGIVEGGFVTAWTGGNSLDGYEIYARITYWNESTQSPEFRVNFNTTNAQRSPTVIGLNNGQFQISWDSDGQDGDGYGIFKRRYAQNGTPLSSDQQVNIDSTGSQYFPSSAHLANGGSVIVWREFISSTVRGLYGRLFDDFGIGASSELPISNFNNISQNYPKVAGLSNGGFAAVWESDSQFDGYSWDIVGRVFDSNGDPVANEFQINTNTPGDQRSPEVAALSSGGFVAVWQSFGQAGDDAYGVFGRRFSSSGSSLGGEFHVNSYTLGSQDDQSVAGLEGGGFVAVWESSDQIDGGRTVYGQLYDSNGSRRGGEFSIEDNAISYVRYPGVSALSDGGFVVVWESTDQDGDLEGIYAKVFDSSGVALAPNFLAQASPTTPTMQTSESFGLTGLQTSSNSLSITTASTSAQSTQTLDVGSSSNTLPESTLSAGSRPTQGTSTSLTISSSQATNTPTPSIPSPSSISTPTALAASTNPSNPSSLFSSNSPVEESRGSAGFPGWAWAVIGAGTAACLGLLGLLGYKKLKKKENEPDPEKNPAKLTSVPPVRLEGFESSKSSSSSSESSKSSSSVVEPARVNKSPKTIDSKPRVIQYVPEYENKPVKNEDLFEKNGILNLKNRHQETLQVKLLRDVSPEAIELVRSQTGYLMKEKTKSGITGYFIAMGNFGVVWVGQEVDGEKRFVAVKEVQGKQAVQESKREGELLSKLREAPNIIPFYGESGSNDWMFQATHLAGFGDGMELAKKLVKLDQDKQSKVLADVAKGLLNGVCAMHARHIYHLDLKWENVVFDLTGETFIIDFGNARELLDGICKKRVNGDTEFFSPEYYERNKKAEEKRGIDPISVKELDAWSIGTCLLNLVKRKNCFSGQGIGKVNGKVVLNRDPNTFAAMLEKELADLPVPQELGDVIRGLLEIDPEKRMSPEDAKDRLSGIVSYNDPAERLEDFAKMKGLVVQKKIVNQ